MIKLWIMYKIDRRRGGVLNCSLGQTRCSSDKCLTDAVAQEITLESF